MCGHATIALGRFLVDIEPGSSAFPFRRGLTYDAENERTVVRIHAPCGVVLVHVPTSNGQSREGEAVTFFSVPSFVTARALSVKIPGQVQWNKLKEALRDEVKVDLAYGGAFYAIVPAEELGFIKGIKGDYSLKDFEEAARVLKQALEARGPLFSHPRERDLEYLYGIMVVDKTIGEGGELGLCFFADGQIDRSPTGSCVSARVALGVEGGLLAMGEWWRYESIVSIQHEGNHFEGCGFEQVSEGLVVKVKGRAHYIGASSFVAEDLDDMADGFILQLP